MENEKRLIDANEAVKLLRGKCVAKYPNSFLLGLLAAATEIEQSPTVDAVPVVHGRWAVSRESEISKNVWCTACGEDFYIRKKIGAVVIDKMPYCPNCGAKMDGDGNV